MLIKRRSAFSLIEILIAIAIVAAVTALILRSAGGLRGQANTVVARDHVRKVQEAYDQWLSEQPSVEYARSQFNAVEYVAEGATSVAASYPDPATMENILGDYLDSNFLNDLSKHGNGNGEYSTRVLDDLGGHMTIFWDPDYRNTNIKALITLP